MNRKEAVGKFGEEIARDFLVKKGYEIINCNLKLSYKEIDIIAKRGDFLVFVEVKTRSSSLFGTAADALGSIKIGRFKKAAGHYLGLFKGLDFKKVRLDFIAVDLNKETKLAKIKHFIDIV